MAFFKVILKSVLCWAISDVGCFCRAQYDPVCCSGEQFGNLCEADCANATGCEDGPCPKEGRHHLFSEANPHQYFSLPPLRTVLAVLIGEQDTGLLY